MEDNVYKNEKKSRGVPWYYNLHKYGRFKIVNVYILPVGTFWNQNKWSFAFKMDEGIFFLLSYKVEPVKD